MSLKIVKKLVLPIISEDGRITEGPVTIRLNTSDPVHFVIELPAFVQAALGGQPDVRVPALDGAVEAYRHRLRDYGQWRRTAVAVPVLIVNAKYRARREGERSVERDTFGMNQSPPCVTFTFERAFRIDTHIHRSRDGAPGERMYVDKSVVVLDYSIEVEMRLQLIRDRLTDAIYGLDMLLSSDDVAQVLLTGKIGLLGNA